MAGRARFYDASVKFLPLVFFVSQNFFRMPGQKNLRITFRIMKLSYKEAFVSRGSTVLTTSCEAKKRSLLKDLKC